MVEDQLRILQVSTVDVGGGAEKVAFDLFRTYRKRGFASALAVGMKVTTDDDVLLIPNELRRSGWAKLWLGESSAAASQFDRLKIKIAEPWRTVQQLMGREDFNFPGSRHLL